MGVLSPSKTNTCVPFELLSQGKLYQLCESCSWQIHINVMNLQQTHFLFLNHKFVLHQVSRSQNIKSLRIMRNCENNSKLWFSIWKRIQTAYFKIRRNYCRPSLWIIFSGRNLAQSSCCVVAVACEGEQSDCLWLSHLNNMTLKTPNHFL